MFFRNKIIQNSLSKVSEKLDLTDSELEQSRENVDIHSTVEQTPPSIISADVKIVGQIYSEGEVQIDGNYEGDIRAKVLLVGETGVIKGEVIAQTVHIHGSVNGHVKAREVNLAKTAHVIGNIFHESMSIETGAFLEGNCRSMETNKNGKVDVFEFKDPNHLKKIKKKESDEANPSKKKSS